MAVMLVKLLVMILLCSASAQAQALSKFNNHWLLQGRGLLAMVELLMHISKAV